MKARTVQNRRRHVKTILRDNGYLTSFVDRYQGPRHRQQIRLLKMYLQNAPVHAPIKEWRSFIAWVEGYSLPIRKELT